MKKVSFLLTAIVLILVSAPQTDAESGFTDVSIKSAYYDGIHFMQEHGFVNGYLDGTYRSYNKINRAEFMKIITLVHNYQIDLLEKMHPNGPYWEDAMCIYIMGGCDPDIKQCFLLIDVQLNDWFAPYVCHGISQKIIDGYPDKTFRPANNINIAEASKIIAGTFDLDISSFDRAQDDIMEWYGPYMDALRVLDVLPSIIDSPDHLLTRGEMAEIIYRVMINE